MEERFYKSQIESDKELANSKDIIDKQASKIKDLETELKNLKDHNKKLTAILSGGNERMID